MYKWSHEEIEECIDEYLMDFSLWNKINDRNHKKIKMGKFECKKGVKLLCVKEHHYKHKQQIATRKNYFQWTWWTKGWYPYCKVLL